MELTQYLKKHFEGLNAEVEVDEFANIIARYPGRGRGRDLAPIALMIHLDTAHGTIALPKLNQTTDWQGESLQFERNSTLEVNTHHYPSLEQFLGQSIIHGFGDAPFGLDDKLGLTHLLSLASILNDSEMNESVLAELDLPPVWLIGRPDEEIGRDDALIGLASKLQQAGISRGYTIDGIEPFEINIANFFAAKAKLTVPATAPKELLDGVPLQLSLGGVNTHGATAHAEGHRSALRWAAEIWSSVQNHGVRLCHYEPSMDRECDGTLYLWAPHLEAGMLVREALNKYVHPHIPRGASVSMEEWQVKKPPHADPCLENVLSYLRETLFTSNFTYPLLAEDSKGWEGYSHPAQLSLNQEEQTWELAWRLRDFDLLQLCQRATDLEQSAQQSEHIQGTFEWSRQYDNMAARRLCCISKDTSNQ